MNYSLRIADEVRAEIARQRITIGEVAARTAIPRNRLSRKLNGHFPLDTDELEAISGALGVLPSTFTIRAELPKIEVPA